MKANKCVIIVFGEPDKFITFNLNLLHFKVSNRPGSYIVQTFCFLGMSTSKILTKKNGLRLLILDSEEGNSERDTEVNGFKY